MASNELTRASKKEAFAALERLCGPVPKSGHIRLFRKSDGTFGGEFEYFAGGHELVMQLLTGQKETGGD